MKFSKTGTTFSTFLILLSAVHGTWWIIIKLFLSYCFVENPLLLLWLTTLFSQDSCPQFLSFSLPNWPALVQKPTNKWPLCKLPEQSLQCVESQTESWTILCQDFPAAPPQVTQTLQPPGILYLWKGAASLLYCRSNWVNELQLQISFQTETRTEKLNKITTSYFSEHLCAVSHFVNFKRFVVGTQEPKNNIKSFNHWPFISSYQIHY